MSPFILVSAVVLLALGVLLIRAKTSTISASQAKALVNGGALLLDVRSPSEFASGHIDGAKNIPVQSLGERINEMPSKEESIVVYCKSGMRSAAAKKQLEFNGFENVHNLGAMSRWK